MAGDHRRHPHRRIAQAITADFPALKISAKENTPIHSADFSAYASGDYSIGGRITADGWITFDRLNVTPEKARAILAIILGDPA